MGQRQLRAHRAVIGGLIGVEVDVAVTNIEAAQQSSPLTANDINAINENLAAIPGALPGGPTPTD